VNPLWQALRIAAIEPVTISPTVKPSKAGMITTIVHNPKSPEISPIREYKAILPAYK
jgi:hypothetical protein